MRSFFFALALGLASPLFAAENGELVDKAIEQHVLPRFEQLAEATEHLKTTALTSCAPDSTALQNAFHKGFDAWIGVSHLRFGPTETDERAFALAFWPDTKGFTSKTLTQLISSEDSAIATPEDFSAISIAGRGFFALEFLLFDEGLSQKGSAAYRCALVQAIAFDIDTNADAILTEWKEGYADLMRNPGENSPYRTDDESIQELYKALDAGLQFTADTRLGRPLGSYERPRPRRAEAWRSERSLRNVILSISALSEFAEVLSQASPELQGNFGKAFGRAQAKAEALKDPTFEGVSDVQTRFRIEVLQQDLNLIRDLWVGELGLLLGVAAGFNALDGD